MAKPHLPAESMSHLTKPPQSQRIHTASGISLIVHVIFHPEKTLLNCKSKTPTPQFSQPHGSSHRTCFCSRVAPRTCSIKTAVPECRSCLPGNRLVDDPVSCLPHCFLGGTIDNGCLMHHGHAIVDVPSSSGPYEESNALKMSESRLPCATKLIFMGILQNWGSPISWERFDLCRETIGSWPKLPFSPCGFQARLLPFTPNPLNVQFQSKLEWYCCLLFHRTT